MSVKSPRSTAKRISSGKQKPRNLDKKNDAIKKAEAYAASIQSHVRNWERNTPKIRAEITKQFTMRSKLDKDSKRYLLKKIVRKWGGDVSKFEDML